MSHLISIELDNDVAKGLLKQFSRLPKKHSLEKELCDAIEIALDSDDAEEDG